MEHIDQLGDDCGISKDDTLTATAIAGGNVNYAFCVTNTKTNKTIFVKQAPEFVAIFGPDGFPLTSQRMQQEMDVYQEWNNLLGTELSSKYLPKIYYFDSKFYTRHSVFVSLVSWLIWFVVLDPRHESYLLS